MANNPNEAPADNFFEQILRFPSFAPTEMGLAGPDGGLAETTAAAGASMMLQLNSVDGAGHLRAIGGGGVGAFHGQIFPLELSLEQGKGGFLKPEKLQEAASAFATRYFIKVFRGQPIPATVAGAPHPPVMCPRVRARRGQATDPHSIAEHLRRERITERTRALQELVPSVNKIDRAAVLDEIVDCLKFLRLQVRVLSMSRMGGAGAVAPLLSDTPLSSDED